MTHATIHFDGASRGNPGAMAGGAVVEIERMKTKVHGAVGHGTNNEAEYDGLIIGLESALERGATTATVKGDSELIIRQLMGEYKVKAGNLKERHRRAAELLDRFESVELQWVARELNREADAVANESLDGPGLR